MCVIVSSMTPRGFLSLTAQGVEYVDVSRLVGSVICLHAVGNAVWVLPSAKGKNHDTRAKCSGAQVLKANGLYQVPIKDGYDFAMGEVLQITYNSNQTAIAVLQGQLGARSDRMEVVFPLGLPSPNLADDDVIKSALPAPSTGVGMRIPAGTDRFLRVPTWAKYIAAIEESATDATLIVTEVG